jgi:hypothetical protein
MRIRLLSVAALLAVLSAPAAAQQATPAESLTAARARAIAALRPGDRVRLSLAGDGVVEGRFVGASVDSVRFADRLGPRAVGLVTVDGVWTRRRHTLLGAAIGGTVVGVSSGFLFYAIGAAVCSDGGGGCHRWAFATLGALGGAAAGALIGGALGSALTGWSRRFP